VGDAAGPRRRRIAWIVFVVGAGITLGAWALLAAALLAVWHALRQPRLRVLILISCGLAVLIPVTWLVGQPTLPVTPTTQMVSDNLVPHYVSSVLLVVVTAVVLRLERMLGGRMRPSPVSTVSPSSPTTQNVEDARRAD
jgi:MFS family permease